MEPDHGWGNRLTKLGVFLVRNGAYPPLGLATAHVIVVPDPSILGWLGLLLGLLLFEIGLAAILLLLGYLLSDGGPRS